MCYFLLFISMAHATIIDITTTQTISSPRKWKYKWKYIYRCCYDRCREVSLWRSYSAPCDVVKLPKLHIMHTATVAQTATVIHHCTLHIAMMYDCHCVIVWFSTQPVTPLKPWVTWSTIQVLNWLPNDLSITHRNVRWYLTITFSRMTFG